MLTKLMAAAVMTGALWVVGDSLKQEFCSFDGSHDCCPLMRLLHGGSTATDSDCCSSVSRSSCCEQSAPSCCDEK